MRVIKYLLRKEFLQIFRDKTILKMIVMMPTIQLLILPWAATFEQKNIALSIVDNDHSSYSRELTEKILSSGYFRLTDYSASYSQALQAIERNEADLVLEIPHNFESSLIREQNANLMMSVNAVNGQKAGLGSSYLAQIIADYNRQIIIQNTDNAGVGMLSVVPYFKYNAQMSYKNFMVPGILVMLLTLIGGVLSAVNIVKEKEVGTIEQINVTPISRGIFIFAKLIPFWIMGLFILTLGITIAWLVYGILPAGGLHTIYIFAFFYLVAFSAFGLVISNYSNTQQQAMFVTFFFFIVFFLLSGLYTPINSMPHWAQVVTRFNPVRYFIEMIRLVYMKGASFSYIIPQLLHIFGFAILFITWAVLSYRKTRG